LNRLLTPLVPLYAAAVGTKDLAYARGWVRPKRLARPVISVGNLSVGGSGKTPLTIRLAELLRERGIAVDVLSRGYGRHSQAVARVNPAGSVEEFGDEPLLMARMQIPVFVGADRWAAGRLAEAEGSGTGVHLLDDGFQHRSLARNVDLVALHRSDFAQRLLPAGRLRENFAALGRARFVVMREEDRDLEEDLRRRGFRGAVWWVERRVRLPLVHRVVAFCAIARPEEFFAAIHGQGIAIAAARLWRDHHPYTHADLAELMELQRQHAAEAFLTTEKDLVRISAEQQRELTSAAPLHAAELQLRLSDEAAAMDELLALLSPEGASPDGPGRWDTVRK
jgi:tetraacyldisaccharide 4'-kinase